MNIKIIGKGIDLGSSLREYAEKKIENLIDKYIGENVDSSITISKDNRLFNVDACIYLNKGFVIKTEGVSDDPYKAVDLSIERLDGRIRKHKNRLKDKKRRLQWNENSIDAMKYTMKRDDTNNNAENNDESHLIIAEQDGCILSLSVSEAVMKLDLTETPVAMFKNADSGRINVVYKRRDGNIGWIDYKQ